MYQEKNENNVEDIAQDPCLWDGSMNTKVWDQSVMNILQSSERSESKICHDPKC